MGLEPVIRWTGGKRRLLPSIIELLPEQIDYYVEPFLGGGAVCLELLPNNAMLNDSNSELINMYNVVRNNPEQLVDILKDHDSNDNKEYYLKIRELDRLNNWDNVDSVIKAARFIYLNRTCFNGLYRVNKKGYFNVPYDSHTKHRIVYEDAINNLSNYLNNNNVNLFNLDYNDFIIDQLLNNNNIMNNYNNIIVYFDPPYAPLSETESFTSYTKHGFTLEDQVKLKCLCDILNESNIKWVLSNSTANIIYKLYNKYNIHHVEINRLNGRLKSSRKRIQEVLITNY